MSQAVTVIGADRLERTLRALADDLRNLSDAHARAGGDLAVTAAQNVHRRSGRLARSITVTVDRDGPTVTAGSAAVRYAGPIEGGWRAHHITPQRFMARAVASRADSVVNTYVAAVRDATRQVKGA